MLKYNGSNPQIAKVEADQETLKSELAQNEAEFEIDLANVVSVQL